MRTSGEYIVSLIAKSPSFESIGLVKARKLWDKFGEELYEILNKSDIDSLSSVLTRDVAAKVVSAWSRFSNIRTLQWLCTHGFTVSLCKKVFAFFGTEMQEKIEQDPYRLLSFSAKWSQVDNFALNHLAIATDDRRRFHGAVEEILYRQFGAGNTAINIDTLERGLYGLLDIDLKSKIQKYLFSIIHKDDFEGTVFKFGPTRLVHLLGPLLMEKVVAKAIADRVKDNDEKVLLDPIQVDALIDEYQLTLDYPHY